MKQIIAVLLCCCWLSTALGQSEQSVLPQPGAARLDKYLPLLKGRRVAVFANQTATVGTTHLVDTLLKSGIQVVKIFSPEHGFRGNADAGEHVGNATDSQTGLEVISLYGDHKKPSEKELANVDVLLFDIQDVGVRFYTYISSLQYYLEAAVQYNKPLIILDRPNPNGGYVDGPVLDKKFASFVGMQPIPVVYDMTIGEYANMLLGEKWLNTDILSKPDFPMGLKNKFQLTVIPCTHYTHKSTYDLPVKPSPNLPNMQSIYLYPSLCFFEGTQISLGRGTSQPFQCFGHPDFPTSLYSFTPASTPGAKSPPLKDKTCYGYDLSPSILNARQAINRHLQLKWLLKAYQLFPDKNAFFLKNGAFFDNLAGTDQLRKQLQAGLSEQAIRKSWEPGLKKFLAIRKKYLLYE